MTFLELCQLTHSDLGLSSNNPSNVIGQDGMNKHIVEWVQQSDFLIQNMFHDWKFMWSEASLSVATGSSSVTAPSDLHHIDPETIMLDDGTTKYELELQSYRDYKQDTKFSLSTGQPGKLTVKPDNTLAINTTSDANYTLTFDYYKSPEKMTVSTDEPNIPEAHQRLIVLRAKMAYAEHREVREIMDYIYTEYEQSLTRLISDQLPNQEHQWTGENTDITVVVQ